MRLLQQAVELLSRYGLRIEVRVFGDEAAEVGVGHDEWTSAAFLAVGGR